MDALFGLPTVSTTRREQSRTLIIHLVCINIHLKIIETGIDLDNPVTNLIWASLRNW